MVQLGESLRLLKVQAAQAHQAASSARTAAGRASREYGVGEYGGSASGGAVGRARSAGYHSRSRSLAGARAGGRIGSASTTTNAEADGLYADGGAS